MKNGQENRHSFAALSSDGWVAHSKELACEGTCARRNPCAGRGMMWRLPTVTSTAQKELMLTGLTVGFDCPPGLVSLLADGDGADLVRLVPQGEVDACLLVSRRPLFATGNQSLQPELLLDEVLSQQPQFRVVRRSPAEQIQSSLGRMHLLRVVGWHGEPKIALGQLVALFSPTNPALPSCAAVSIFIWYTEKAGRKYAPQAMALFRSLRVMPVSQQSWPPSDVLIPSMPST